MNAETINPHRTAEGWLIIHSERRNDDPYTHDDCWHRGPYTVATVPGTTIRVEANDLDTKPGQMWTELEGQVRAAGLAGICELTGHFAKGRDYRVIHTIDTTEELAAKLVQCKAWDEEYALNCDPASEHYEDFPSSWD